MHCSVTGGGLFAFTKFLHFFSPWSLRCYKLQPLYGSTFPSEQFHLNLGHGDFHFKSECAVLELCSEILAVV